MEQVKLHAVFSENTEKQADKISDIFSMFTVLQNDGFFKNPYLMCEKSRAPFKTFHLGETPTGEQVQEHVSLSWGACLLKQ